MIALYQVQSPSTCLSCEFINPQYQVDDSLFVTSGGGYNESASEQCRAMKLGEVGGERY